MNKLTVAELLSRFFPIPMLSKHLVSLGKSGNGNGPTLSARLASHWAAPGTKRPKVESKTDLAWGKERDLAVVHTIIISVTLFLDCRSKGCYCCPSNSEGIVERWQG